MIEAIDPTILILVSTTLGGMLRVATPILLTALGDNFTQSSGTLNLATEGMMLTSAFISYVVALSSGSLAVGLLAGAIVGVVMGLLFAFITVTLGSDQIVTGIAFTITSIGFTSYALRIIYGAGIPPRLPSRDFVALPYLSSIPFFGETVFTQALLVWITLVLVPVCYFVGKTKFGLRIRAVGEDPSAADINGIDVYKYRYVALIMGGALAGLAGGYLSLYQLSLFIDNMTQGRGWIAVAIVMFGRWNPVWIFVGSLIYGGAEALSGVIQAFGLLRGVPPEFLLTFPYMFTIFALVVVARRASFPSALGRPYRREGR